MHAWRILTACLNFMSVMQQDAWSLFDQQHAAHVTMMTGFPLQLFACLAKNVGHAPTASKSPERKSIPETLPTLREPDNLSGVRCMSRMFCQYILYTTYGSDAA